MILSLRHSARRDSRLPLLLVYLGVCHELELSHHPNGPGFHLLYYCTKGRGDFELEKKRILLHPGQCFLARRDTAFSCKASDRGCTIHLLGFAGSCCDVLLDACGLKEAGVYQVRSDEVFHCCMEDLTRLHREGAAQGDYSMRCYRLLLELSSCLDRLTDAPTEAAGNEAVWMVIDYLETHYAERVSLDRLSEEVHLTKEYLCAIFKRETGHTIGQYLTLVRIGRARLYLEQYPEKRAWEIGQMCGFESPSYFGKKFLAVVGMTPERYRRVNSIVV